MHPVMHNQFGSNQYVGWRCLRSIGRKNINQTSSVPEIEAIRTDFIDYENKAFR
jgi:hypothetical protein